MADALWTWSDLVAAAGGEADGADPGLIGNISIDSRAVAEGDLFVALKDRRDGHDFVTTAFQSGARAALVSRGYQRKPGDVALLRVDDTLSGLERIGMAARARLGPDAKVIGVTGSVGKTTTKEMLKACLSRLGSTHAADKSFNNHWGVPLTLARMPADTKYGVFEIGMNHAGEITPLTKMVRPDVAIITTVAPVHLEHFASVEEIAAAKAEILTGLSSDGRAVLNGDNEHYAFLRSEAERLGASVCTFGTQPGSNVMLEASEAKGELTEVTVGLSLPTGTEQVTYQLSLPGQHIVMNSLAVVGALQAVGADLSVALPGLAEMSAPQGRGVRTPLQVEGGAALLIDESYNANPVSMRAAIELLGSVSRDDFPRRIAVIGDMLELGADERRFHEDLLEPLQNAEVGQVFTVGPRAKALFEVLPTIMRGGCAEEASGLEAALLQAIKPGDVIMIKGSNGARTFELAAALKRHFGR
ncbi:MAG: UDP-N-acetylmuramoyl-tripeptide--D-alanyl-D-alanine ligase [Filomicrobium sp.]